MNRLQTWGGYAALFEAAAYAFGIALGFSVLAPYMTGALDPVQTVAFFAEHRATIYLWNQVILILFGIALVVLSLALHERIRSASPDLARVATAFGLLWAGLVLASGMIFNVGTAAVVDLHGTDPTAAGAAWTAIAAVQNGLGGGNELVGGLWTLLVSVAALRQRVLPRALNLVGVVVGAAGLVTLLPALEPVGLVFGLGQIVWFTWLGVVLARGAVAAREARPVAVPSRP